jgi:hypothetical protein
MAEQASQRPSGKVTDVFRGAAERQGAYGLLESEEVSASDIARSMFESCARRSAKERFVFCPVDGSSLTLTDQIGSKNFGSVGSRTQGGRGLKMINAMVLSPRGVPLGLSAQIWWARSLLRNKTDHASRRTEDKETQRWLDAMEATRQVFREHAPETRLWFQVDREGDAWPILEQADKGGHWFTIRGNHNRRVVLASGRRSYLREVIRRQAVLHRYDLPVTAGQKRSARKAHMVIRACAMTLDFLDQRTKKHFPKAVNVVLVREQGTTPRGEKPIEWMLLTNRPLDTTEGVEQIVFGYAQRWRIEEFHRVWKSGACRIEETQLRSIPAVVKWASIMAAVAVRIERIKQLARHEPDTPATDEFSAIEIRAIVLLRFGKQADKHLPKGASPTIAQVTNWLGQLGGHSGSPSAGPPGSTTLARGLRDVHVAVQALRALDVQ